MSQRRLQRTGHPGQQHRARLQFGKGGYPLRGQDLLTEQGALHQQASVITRKVAQQTGGGGRVVVGAGQTGRTGQQFAELGPAHLLNRTAGQGHLDDPELAPGRPQPPAQLLLLLDRQAGVFGDEHGLRPLEALPYVGDRLDLLGSWHPFSLTSGEGFPSHEKGSRTQIAGAHKEPGEPAPAAGRPLALARDQRSGVRELSAGG